MIKIIVTILSAVLLAFWGGIFFGFFNHETPELEEQEPEVAEPVKTYDFDEPTCCEKYEEMKELYYISLERWNACKEDLAEYDKLDFGPLFRLLEKTKK